MRFVAFFILCFSFFAHGQSAEGLIRRLDERYSDFFARRLLEERRERTRNTGVNEVRSEREMNREIRERARREYVRLRKPPPDQTESYQIYLREQERKRQAQLVRERDHARVKDEVDKALRRGKKIPDVLEYDLQDAL